MGCMDMTDKKRYRATKDGSVLAPGLKRGMSGIIFYVLMEPERRHYWVSLTDIVNSVKGIKKITSRREKTDRVKIKLKNLLYKGYILERSWGRGIQYCAATRLHFDTVQSRIPPSARAGYKKPEESATCDTDAVQTELDYPTHGEQDILEPYVKPETAPETAPGATVVVYRSVLKAITTQKQFMCTDGTQFSDAIDAAMYQAELGFMEWYTTGKDAGEDPTLDCEGVTVKGPDLVLWLREYQREITQFFAGANLSDVYGGDDP